MIRFSLEMFFYKNSKPFYKHVFYENVSKLNFYGVIFMLQNHRRSDGTSKNNDYIHFINSSKNSYGVENSEQIENTEKRKTNSVAICGCLKCSFSSSGSFGFCQTFD